MPYVGFSNQLPTALLLILLPMVSWCIFVVPWLLKELKGGGWVLLILAVMLFMLTLMPLMLAHLVEPGLLPTTAEDLASVEGGADSAKNGKIPTEESDEENGGLKRAAWFCGEAPKGGTRKKHVVMMSGSRYDMNTFRAKVCRETENAVENFDHFCPWVGNVVGRRNYRYFVLFILTVPIFSLFIGFTSAYVVVVNANRFAPSDTGEDDHSLENVMAPAIIAVYAGVFACTLCGLSSYHLNLIAEGQTTNEDLKHVYTSRANPNNKGCCSNYRAFFCSSVRKSYVDDDEFIEEDTSLQNLLRSRGDGFSRASDSMDGAPLGSLDDTRTVSSLSGHEQMSML